MTSDRGSNSLAFIQAPETSPWGHVDASKKHADGIFFVSTSSHGGFWLAPEINERIPDYMRQSNGFYEEDVEWTVVVTVFPDILPAGDPMIARAEEILRHWKPDAWQAFYGKPLNAAMSHTLARTEFEAAHINDQIVVAAWGSPVPGISEHLIPAGQVLVCARRGGRQFDHHPARIAHETWHIVPLADYQARGAQDFVVPAGTPETDLRPYGEKAT